MENKFHSYNIIDNKHIITMYDKTKYNFKCNYIIVFNKNYIIANINNEIFCFNTNLKKINKKPFTDIIHINVSNISFIAKTGSGYYEIYNNKLNVISTEYDIHNINKRTLYYNNANKSLYFNKFKSKKEYYIIIDKDYNIVFKKSEFNDSINYKDLNPTIKYDVMKICNNYISNLN